MTRSQVVIGGVAVVAIIGASALLFFGCQPKHEQVAAVKKLPDISIVRIHYNLPDNVAMVRYDIFGPASLPTANKLGLLRTGDADFISLPYTCPDERPCDMERHEAVALADKKHGIPVIKWRMQGGYQPGGAGENTLRLPSSIYDNYCVILIATAPNGHEQAKHACFHPSDRGTDIDFGSMIPNRTS